MTEIREIGVLDRGRSGTLAGGGGVNTPDTSELELATAGDSTLALGLVALTCGNTGTCQLPGKVRLFVPEPKYGV